MKNAKNVLWKGIFALGLCGAMVSCGGKDKQAQDQSGATQAEKTTQEKVRITVKGSDTMVDLTQQWAERYMEIKGRQVIIQVTGGGTGTGIASLVNKTTDIVNASRQIEVDENALLEARGHKTQEFKVAKDGLSIYVNQANPISKMTLEDLKHIFSGKKKNWKDFGGKDAPIILYGRDNSSGTYAFFKKEVLHGLDYAITLNTLPGTGAIVHAISKDENGIGYGGIGSAHAVNIVSLKAVGYEADEGEYYEPTVETITTRKYPLFRFLYVYTTDKVIENKPYVKDYIDWFVTHQAQALVKKTGYFPLIKLNDDHNNNPNDKDHHSEQENVEQKDKTQ